MPSVILSRREFLGILEIREGWKSPTASHLLWGKARGGRGRRRGEGREGVPLEQTSMTVAAPSSPVEEH